MNSGLETTGKNRLQKKIEGKGRGERPLIEARREKTETQKTKKGEKKKRKKKKKNKQG